MAYLSVRQCLESHLGRLNGWRVLELLGTESILRFLHSQVWHQGWDPLKTGLSYDCHLEHLHMASPCGLGFLQHGAWVLKRSAPRESIPREGIPRNLGRSCMIFYTHLQKWYCFTCHILLFKVIRCLPKFKQKGT